MFDDEKILKFVNSAKVSKYEEKIQHLKKKIEKTAMESLLQLNIQEKHSKFLRSSIKQVKENHSSTVTT
jgi:hypothetical protein